MEWKHVKFKEEGNLGQLNFFGQILKKGKNLSTRSGNVEGMIRFRGPFNSTNRATTRFSFGGFRSKHLITVKRINTGTERKIVRAEMFARRRIIFRRGGLISAKVKGNKKWSNC